MSALVVLLIILLVLAILDLIPATSGALPFIDASLLLALLIAVLLLWALGILH